MKTVLLSALFALLLPLNAAALQFFTFYAECNLGLIDTFTETSTEVGSLGEWGVEAMDYGPDGLLYATVEEECRVHGVADTLAIIDPETLTVYPIGPIGFYDVDALAFSPSGELFAVSMTSSALIRIDPGTGEGYWVGPLTGLEGNFLGAIAFRRDGILYGIDMAEAGGGPSKLYTIDTDTGAASLVGPLGFDSVEGMTLNTGGFGSLMALANSMEADQIAQLIRIDHTTGEGIFVRDMPLPLPDYEGQRDALVALPAIEIPIDVKPWSWPNSVNVRKNGVIPVAVLSTEAFDATTIRTRVAHFGPAGARIVHDAAHYEDVNLDGYLDLLMHFNSDETGIECGDEFAELRSSNEVGLSVVGTDQVRTVGCN
ncbi:MAG: NHL repeat-containing protein [Planctomycetota bacterium]|jgi:hypothetical protein